MDDSWWLHTLAVYSLKTMRPSSVCVRACMRACVRACTCVRVCVCVCACTPCVHLAHISCEGSWLRSARKAQQLSFKKLYCVVLPGLLLLPAAPASRPSIHIIAAQYAYLRAIAPPAAKHEALQGRLHFCTGVSDTYSSSPSLHAASPPSPSPPFLPSSCSASRPSIRVLAADYRPRVYVPPKAEHEALQAARQLATHLQSEEGGNYPCLIRQMMPSHVSGGFWLVRMPGCECWLVSRRLKM